jgi:Fic family protein
MASHLNHPFDESLLKEVNRLVTEHTLTYRAPEAIPGEYTTEDMAAGDTVFGDHETLIARIPNLMASTEKAINDGQHPIVVAAKWHGYYEYLHPFRDGNGRTGRLLSNFILLRANHPLLIIRLEDRAAYISALKQIRTEGTDEHLISFFFKTAINRMKGELAQKRKNTLPTMFF